MENLKELDNKNWDFTLYEAGTKRIFTVMFYGLVDYPRSFYLRETEYLFSHDELIHFAEEIRNNYERFKDRELIPAILK
jgi:hypothetical protein